MLIAFSYHVPCYSSRVALIHINVVNQKLCITSDAFFEDLLFFLPSGLKIIFRQLPVMLTSQTDLGLVKFFYRQPNPLFLLFIELSLLMLNKKMNIDFSLLWLLLNKIGRYLKQNAWLPRFQYPADMKIFLIFLLFMNPYCPNFDLLNSRFHFVEIKVIAVHLSGHQLTHYLYFFKKAMFVSGQNVILTGHCLFTGCHFEP